MWDRDFGFAGEEHDVSACGMLAQYFRSEVLGCAWKGEGPLHCGCDVGTIVSPCRNYAVGAIGQATQRSRLRPSGALFGGNFERVGQSPALDGRFVVAGGCGGQIEVSGPQDTAREQQENRDNECKVVPMHVGVGLCFLLADRCYASGFHRKIWLTLCPSTGPVRRDLRPLTVGDGMSFKRAISSRINDFSSCYGILKIALRIIAALVSQKPRAKKGPPLQSDEYFPRLRFVDCARPTKTDSDHLVILLPF